MVLAQRLLRVVPVVLIASVACWAASLNNDDFCGNVGECIGLSFDDIVVLLLALVTAPILLRLLRVPRVLLHTVVAVLATCTLWYAAGEMLRVRDPDRAYDALVPLPAALSAGLLGGVTAAYVAGAGGRRTRRAAALVAVVLVAVAASAASEHASREDRVAEIAAVPVTLYVPVVAGQGPTDASASTDTVSLSYTLEVGAERHFLVVALVPSSAEPPPGEVVVVRGETTLVAGFDVEELDPDDVTAALRPRQVMKVKA